MPANVAARRDERNEFSDDEHLGRLTPETEPIVLTARDWEVVVATWDDDRPRPRLEAAAQRYRDRRA